MCLISGASLWSVRQDFIYILGHQFVNKVFVKCLLKVPLAYFGCTAAAVQPNNGLWTRRNILQNLFRNLTPRTAQVGPFCRPPRTTLKIGIYSGWLEMRRRRGGPVRLSGERETFLVLMKRAVLVRPDISRDGGR